jgi:phosphoglycolate phosphatase-like HAD superfamily hydrolase
MRAFVVQAGMLCVLWLAAVPAAPAADEAVSLPSWSDGTAKQAILRFVREVTDQGGSNYVRPAERIAVFDNDGTLWCEQPFYFQGLFVLDRVKALAPKHPEWKEKNPFKAILAGKREALSKSTEHDIAGLLAAAHAGITTDEYAKVAREWLDSARHPRFGRLYKECIYQPQLELLAYLRANGFKTFLVSGGGVDFLRVFAEEVYGIPPEQVVGSSAKTKFEMRAGQPVLVKLPEISNIDDKEGKPVNIHLHIGRRPLLAFGNSDGDLQMLQYTDTGSRPRLMLLLHHDDAEREYAYDRKSHVGRLDKALDETAKRKWTLVSMKNDWKVIFPSLPILPAERLR